MGAVHYNVNPRYTPGSPAQVDRETAARVAVQERQAYVDLTYKHSPEGEESYRRALKYGLGPQKGVGIAEKVEETNAGWRVRCLLTDQEWIRPFGVGSKETPRSAVPAHHKARMGSIRPRDLWHATLRGLWLQVDQLVAQADVDRLGDGNQLHDALLKVREGLEEARKLTVREG